VDLSKPGALCKICVVNRLRVATPLQVTLKVRIAEINRTVLKSMGINRSVSATILSKIRRLESRKKSSRRSSSIA